MGHRASEFFEELRNRSVIRALIAYAVVAWLLLQIADVTFENLPLPEGSMTALIVVVLAGFPITAILAWVYEITRRGIVRHEDAGAEAPRLALLPYVLLVGGVVLVSGAGLYYVAETYWEAPRRTVAVLPFTNASDSAEADYFSDGLTEELRSLILSLNEFNVVAMTSANQFRETSLNVVDIASRLNAGAVLLGSVRKLGDEVSITARLIDGADGSELWSDSYHERVADVVTIQQEVARQVARALHVVLPVESERRLERLGSANVEAYDLYLRSRDLLREQPGEVVLVQAEAYARQAIALDPAFASAHAALCQVHLARYKRSRDASRFNDVETACKNTLKVDADNVEVHLALGGLYSASGDYYLAAEEYEAATRLNENVPDAWIGLGYAHFDLNRPDLAEPAFRRAIDVDVSYWASFNAMGYFLITEGRYLEAAEFFRMFANRATDDATALNNLGAAYYFAGDFRQAAAAYEESIRIKPTRGAFSNMGTMYFYLNEFETAADRYAQAVNLAPMDHRLWGNLADAYYFSNGMHQAADVAYRRAISLGEERFKVNSSDHETAYELAYYYSRVGERQRALELLAVALEAVPDDMYVHYYGALIHAHFGDVDAALASIERAVELDYQPKLLSADPGLRSLVADQRFARLLDGVGG